jgi:hypothetical protein
MTRPGDRIRAIAARLFAAQTMERVIEPVLADLQCEYDEARARGRVWRSRASLVRSYLAFASTLFWLGVRTAWHAGSPRSDVSRMCAVSAVASAVMTVALVIPPLVDWPGWQADAGFTALLSVILVPQALPLSIPAGLCVAVLWGMRGKSVTWRRVGTVLGVALVFTAVVWVVLEWMMPQANQEFREMVASRVSNGRVVAIEPGLNELGLSRLGRRNDPAAVRQYQTLWAVCFASVPLALLALGVSRYVRRAVWAVVLATALSNFYFAMVWSCAASMPGAVLPAWTPNVIVGLIGCALLMRVQRPHNV